MQAHSLPTTNGLVQGKLQPKYSPTLLFGGGASATLANASFQQRAMAEISNNNVLSRFLIEVVGYDPWFIALSRNKYERIERAWDVLTRMVLIMGIPILLEKAIAPVYAKWMHKKLDLPQHLQPLKMDFETLDRKGFSAKNLVNELETSYLGKAAEDAQTKLSKTTKAELASKASKIAKYTLYGKLGIVLIDLLLMASKGQLAFWGKNAITKKLRGKDEFVGDITYTTESYRKQQSIGYKKNKKKNTALSLLVGYGSAVVFPLLMGATLLSKGQKGLGKLTNPLKKMTKFFNYHEAIYMSKWLILWHGVFNFLAPAILSARDKHELREGTVRVGSVMFFYLMADEFIGGLAGKWLEKKHKAKLNGFKLTDTGIFGAPVQRSFRKVMKEAKDHPALKTIQSCQNKILLSSMLGSALLLGVATTAVNQMFTKLKVIKEQQQFLRARYLPVIQRLSPTPIHPTYSAPHSN